LERTSPHCFSSDRDSLHLALTAHALPAKRTGQRGYIEASDEMWFRAAGNRIIVSGI
jgi:hypothetical protein